MNFKQAIRKMQSGKDDQAVATIVAAVDPLIATTTDGSDNNTTLSDWIAEGEFTGDETPESIAAEWNELTEQANG